jgi:hypothetical protein
LASDWIVALPFVFLLVGAALGLVCGRTRSYRRVLACSRGVAWATSLVGLAAGLAAGVLAGVLTARATDSMWWWPTLVGLEAALAADAAGAVLLARVRRAERPGFVALVVAVVGWWLFAAVALAAVLTALMLGTALMAVGISQS